MRKLFVYLATLLAPLSTFAQDVDLSVATLRARDSVTTVIFRIASGGKLVFPDGSVQLSAGDTLYATLADVDLTDRDDWTVGVWNTSTSKYVHRPLLPNVATNTSYIYMDADGDTVEGDTDYGLYQDVDTAKVKYLKVNTSLRFPDGTVQTTSADDSISTAIGIAVSDETTALTTGTAKVTFRMPYALRLTGIRGSVTTAATGATLLTIDVNETASTIMSATKLTFDASEKTTTTATTAAVLSDCALADDAEITIDIDAVGSTIAGAGLKIWLLGKRALP